MTVEEAMAVTIDEALTRIQELEDQVQDLEDKVEGLEAQIEKQAAACKAAGDFLRDATFHSDQAHDYIRTAAAQLDELTS